jgi:hypothetical protein
MAIRLSIPAGLVQLISQNTLTFRFEYNFTLNVIEFEHH